MALRNNPQAVTLYGVDRFYMWSHPCHVPGKVVVALFVDHQLCAETSLVLLCQISKFSSYFLFLSKVVSAHALKKCIVYQ